MSLSEHDQSEKINRSREVEETCEKCRIILSYNVDESILIAISANARNDDEI